MLIIIIDRRENDSIRLVEYYIRVGRSSKVDIFRTRSQCIPTRCKSFTVQSRQRRSLLVERSPWRPKTEKAEKTVTKVLWPVVPCHHGGGFCPVVLFFASQTYCYVVFYQLFWHASLAETQYLCFLVKHDGVEIVFCLFRRCFQVTMFGFN